MARRSDCRRTRVEIVTMRPMPADLARATTSSSSSLKSGKSRWQWLSTSMSRLRGFRLDVARKHRCRGRQRRARRDALAGLAQPVELPLVGRHAQQVEQPAGRGRHERLAQDANLAEYFSG